MKKILILFMMCLLMVSCAYRIDTNQISKSHEIDTDVVTLYLAEQMTEKNTKCVEKVGCVCINSVIYVPESKTAIYDLNREYIEKSDPNFVSEFVHETVEESRDEFERFWVFDEDSEFKYLIITVDGVMFREYRLN